MTFYQLAKQIPAQFRKQLLDGNAIYKAVAQGGDAHMSMLVIIWQNYINTGAAPIDMTNPCLKCLTEILDKFKILEPELIKLEKEKNLLEA